MMQHWMLPDSVEDVLPAAARRLEYARGRLLETFRRSGYELVVPPLIEFVESLLVSKSDALNLRTFRLIDRDSGRGMGVRADITPQVARIDAHVLAYPGIARLCYCGSVLHAIPRDVMAAREPIQIGAELYGCAGFEADYEIIRLMADSLGSLSLPAQRIDLNHVGVYRALSLRARLDPDREKMLFDAMQTKDGPAVSDLLADTEEPYRSALMSLASFCGGAEVIREAQGQMDDLGVPEVSGALEELDRLATMLSDLPISVDLSDLHGYEYHTGIAFAAYRAGDAAAIAVGGRYDGIGKHFGRARPATGFSMDLRAISRMCVAPTFAGWISAPFPATQSDRERIAQLRTAGETVVVELPGQTADLRAAGCDRRLVCVDGDWRIEQLGEMT